jgi:uncharacterized protein YdeI (YjbR/CyaY-like superfamily)
MPKDPRIDAYIAKAQPFAKPVLKHLRAIVHKAIPGVEETLKWGMPSFLSHGAIVCGMASFKAHCAFWFWKGSQIPDTHKIFGRGDKAMGQLGRIGSIKDLPSASILTKYLKAGDALNRSGSPGPRASLKRTTTAARTPADLTRALRQDSKAEAAWKAFPPSHRKEYIEWITEAKTAETRSRRLATSLEWIARGKHRNCRYMASRKA